MCHHSEKIGVELLSVFGWSLEAAVDAFFTGGAGHLGSSAGPAVDTAKVAEVFAKYKEPDGDEIQVWAEPWACMCTYTVPAPWRAPPSVESSGVDLCSTAVALQVSGTERFCTDLGVDPSDPIMLVICWQMRCKNMCVFTLEEWTRGAALDRACLRLGLGLGLGPGLGLGLGLGLGPGSGRGQGSGQVKVSMGARVRASRGGVGRGTRTQAW